MKNIVNLMLALTVFVQIAQGQEVSNTSYIDSNGNHVLRHEITITAPLQDVWNAFTTTEGLKSFAAPVASIDLKVGGIWEASYNRHAVIGDPANIQNEIMSFLPMEMLSIRIVQTPPGFPNPELGKSLWTVLQFHEVEAGRVRVVVTMLGWPKGSESDELFDLFNRGNAYTLFQLNRRLTEGPLRWNGQ
jgi:uncharacterized protein YndB with AHSA1/START domain